MPARALIFDFDGLILDTESTEYRAISELFSDHGQELSRDRFRAGIGTDFDAFAHLEEVLGRRLDVAALKERRARRQRELLDGVPPLPGVVAALAEAKSRGLRVGLASSSPYAWVDGNLERLGLRHHFEAILCRDDVERVKPDPELYLAAVEALRVEPDDTIAFEDSPHGVAAAKAAGLRCVAVPSPMTRSLRFDAADLVLRSLDECPLSVLLARLG